MLFILIYVLFIIVDAIITVIQSLVLFETHKINVLTTILMSIYIFVCNLVFVSNIMLSVVKWNNCKEYEKYLKLWNFLSLCGSICLSLYVYCEVNYTYQQLTNNIMKSSLDALSTTLFIAFCDLYAADVENFWIYPLLI